MNINTDKLFPLYDYYVGDKRFRLPEWGGSISQTKLKAKPTGEFRCPKQNEWYISGAIPEGYKAPNDLSTPYWIAKIVYVEPVLHEQIVEVLGG